MSISTLAIEEETKNSCAQSFYKHCQLVVVVATDLNSCLMLKTTSIIIKLDQYF